MRVTNITPADRRGFTLVELLVTVSIFVILLAITVPAFNIGSDREKISASARQLQSAIEGARSRAFKLGRPVGLRFAIDPTDSTVCRSMTYIQQLEPITGKLDVGASATDSATGLVYSQVRIRSLSQPPDDSRPPDGEYDDDGKNDDGDFDDDGVYDDITTDPNSFDLDLLKSADQQGLLAPGVTIRIKGGSSDYGEYRVATFGGYNVSSATYNGDLTIFPAFHAPGDSLTVVANTNPQQRVRNSLDFEIIPAPIPLQGEEPLVFPNGTVIDWDSSLYPREWSKITSAITWAVNTKYSNGQWIYPQNLNTDQRYFKCVDFGTSGGTEPNWDSVTTNAVVADGTCYWRAYEAPQLDLMFSPRGNAIGSVATNGLIHFCMAYTRDTDRQVFVTTPDPVVQFSVYDVRKNPAGEYLLGGEQRIVTLFLQSGAVSTNEPDYTDVTAPVDIADNPFSYSLTGGEAK